MKWEMLPKNIWIGARGGLDAVRSRHRCALPTAALVTALALLIVAMPALISPGSPGVLAQPSRETPRDKDALVREVVGIDEEINSLSGRLANLEEKSLALKDSIGSVEAEVSGKKKRLSDKRKALSVRVRGIYVNGRANNIDMLLASSDLSDFLQRADFLKKVTSQDAKLIKSVKAESLELEGSLAELKRRGREVGSLYSELKSKRARLTESRSEKRKLLAAAGESSEEVQQQSRQVESKMEEINRPAQAPVPSPKPARHSGRFMTMVATGYSPQEPGLDDHTASGMKATHGVVAVDPSVIPLGTRLNVEGYGYAIAGDTGSAIKGNRIDLCFDTLEEVNSYGWRHITVEILD